MAQLICDDLGRVTTTRLPRASTPTWTAGTFITDKSQAWCTSHTRPIAPTRRAGSLQAAEQVGAEREIVRVTDASHISPLRELN